MMDYRSSIAFIGGGNMAEALAVGIIRARILPAESIIVSDPISERRTYLLQQHGLMSTDRNTQAAAAGGTIFLAVKPQVLPEVLQEIAPSIGTDQLVISIAAGITLGLLENSLPGVPVIRSMPNTPALVGNGATVISPGQSVHADNTHWAVELFQAVGTCHVLPEDLLDAVTGLSGSGPAYIFRMAEALIEAGMSVGIPAEESAGLVKQTIMGAARMMMETEKSPTQLREMVTSPGGTTQAGLAAMDEADFTETVVEAVMAATKRARELGKS
jgi:pyrroline-5-carboxylate reductase